MASTSSSSSDRHFKEKNDAIRLTFSYEGNSIQLVSKQRIQKRLPYPSAAAAAIQKERSTGFWVELSDDKQLLLHRQVIDNPIKIDTEVFSENPNESITRKELTDIRGTFSIIVPAIADAKNLDLFGSPIISEGIRALQKPATRFFHLDLKQLG